VSRRGIVILFTLLGVAAVISVGGLTLLYILLAREPAVTSNSILIQRVGGDLTEVAPADLAGYLRGVRAPTVRSIVDNLRKAKLDPRIHGLLLKPTGFDSSYWGKVQEIRDAVLDFKKSGKPTYAYLEYGGNREYYLASAADRVFLMPSSSLDLNGVASYELFLRGTLDKIGAYPDLHHVGDYKTAINTFTEKGYTPAHKEVDEAIDRDIYDELVRAIAAARKKSEADVRALIDQGPFLSSEALQAGLVDELAYEDQVDDGLRAASGAQPRIDGDDYARVAVAGDVYGRGPKIAVIYVAGTINTGKSGYDPVNGAIVGSETLIENIREARRDTTTRAIVVRIDSPGGSAVASDAIWRELMIARTERADRPIVASMSDLAASGGYYIAAPAHAIVAQPSTLTGSIGIFGGKVVTGGLYAKLGAAIDSTSVGRHAEIDSPARPYNQEELQKLRDQLQAFYHEFVSKVAQSRHSTPEKIDALAQGRVWTGHQAHENGLVDAIGGLDTAIAVAKERAKIPASAQVDLEFYPARKSLYEILSDQFGVSADSRAVGRWLSASFTSGEIEAIRALRGPMAIFRRGEPLALLPFTYLK
jgi:protease IV